jgi:hypothetical protein
LWIGPGCRDIYGGGQGGNWMTFLQEMDPATGLIDAARARETDRGLSEAYNAAKPFPHIVIDDFLPRPVLDMCLREFKTEGQEGATQYDRPQERLKREYKPDQMSEGPRNLFYSFNSRPFITILENITGIKGLIPDPYFSGGGFHEIQTGGYLGVHADFNHHKLLNVERRINVLIYLNEDWRDEYGGQLELWDEGMRECVKSVVPVMNRCVIFNTTSNSNHGNPHPVRHPDGRSRKSIALYYYTATWDDLKRSHTTQFRSRPGTEDKADLEVRRKELIRDFVPPILYRAARKVGQTIRGSKGGPGAGASKA